MILNLATGDYHGLDAMGSAFLEALEETADVGSALETLAAAYDVDAPRLAEDMQKFCARLVDRGLVEVSHDDAA